MKRAWTRLLASASFLFVGGVSWAGQAAQVKSTPKIERNHERILAGVLPGRTRMPRAEALWGKAIEKDAESHSARWNTCSSELTLETDASGVIQTVRVTKHPIPPQGCAAGALAAKWVTGKGLRLGDLAPRVKQLYGKPDSVSPSTKGGQPLELWYYAFDWAGPDVPQVMEVVCTVGKDGEPGRVVEITLAASSL